MMIGLSEEEYLKLLEALIEAKEEDKTEKEEEPHEK